MKIRLLHNSELVFFTEDIMKETLTSYISFPLRIFSQQENRHPQNSLSSCCCCPLFITVTVCKEPNASLSHSNTLTQIQNTPGSLQAQAQVPELRQEILDHEFPKSVKDGSLIEGDHQLEEIFILHMQEISFIIYIIGFGVKEYSMRNNKIGENSEDIVFNILW